MGPTGAAAFYSNRQGTGGLSFPFQNVVGNPNLDIFNKIGVLAPYIPEDDGPEVGGLEEPKRG